MHNEPIDPTDPLTFRAEASPEGQSEAGEAGEATEVAGTTAPAIADRSVEAPEADTAEQRTDLAPTRDDPPYDVDPTAANPADVAEQHRVVAADEDDYR
ncbi:hypothetical protein AAHZ94_30420 [Streptomyces sp. HSW2009]|uniref:hypothetical protein n=1 Tax=Streptomyces sp. HSW2009 TaxID=3142890 RepID=UPI0032EF0E6B